MDLHQALTRLLEKPVRLENYDRFCQLLENSSSATVEDFIRTSEELTYVINNSEIAKTILTEETSQVLLEVACSQPGSYYYVLTEIIEQIFNVSGEALQEQWLDFFIDKAFDYLGMENALKEILLNEKAALRIKAETTFHFQLNNRYLINRIKAQGNLPDLDTSFYAKFAENFYPEEMKTFLESLTPEKSEIVKGLLGSWEGSLEELLQTASTV